MSLNKIEKQMLNFNPATKEELEEVKNNVKSAVVSNTQPTNTSSLWIDTSK